MATCMVIFEEIIMITEKQYRDFIKFRKELNELILEKVNLLALIQRGRLPSGNIYDYDFEEEDGKLFIQFEEWHRGEPDFDTYKLPLEFLFDETYPEKYKIIWEEEQREKTRRERKEEKDIEDEKKGLLEEHDKSEYERLKQKYENS